MNQPWITRHSYSRELITSMTFPVAVGMLESGVVGILAEKAFRVDPLLFATITAAPIFANLTSFFWARLARGRRKVPFIVGLQIGVLILIAAIAMLPTTGIGPILLTISILLMRCMLAGTVTLRSVIWRNNYPRLVRASVTGKLTILNSVIMGFAPLIAFAFLDMNEDAFRIVYPVCALIALLGTRSLSKVRLRHEAELLAYERQANVKPQPRGLPSPIYEYDPADTTPTFLSVLRRDRHFRNYMVLQFIAGGSNMMGEIVLIFMISQITRAQGIAQEYMISILLTTTLPLLIAIAILPRWAKLLDRVHVTEFRAKQSWFWAGDQAMNFVGTMLGSLWIIAAARMVQGFVRGGGMLAWNLGHNDFADRRLVSLYMGIHVTLTGVRGIMFPFIGMFLVAGVDPDGWFGRQFAALFGPFDGIGSYIFILTFVLAVIANIGFHRMARQLAGSKRPED
ncbi:MAG: MFS transporter [Phycisphaeraceae bacterium]|nr:MFS transporter [Phycisphaeraceae bacterium]